MAQIQAVLVDGVRSQLTSDGKTGLLCFQRARPDPNGSRALNIAAPTPLLPYVAAAALDAIPRPEPGPGAEASAHPFVMEARSVKLGLASNGAIVLTLEMDMGARISFAIDQGQAESLQQTVSIALGRRRAQALRAARARNDR
jgi:hypothetical protein